MKTKQTTFLNGHLFDMTINMFDNYSIAMIELRKDEWSHSYPWSYLYQSLNDCLNEIACQLPEHIYEPHIGAYTYEYDLADTLLTLNDESFLFIIGSYYVKVTNFEGEDSYRISIKEVASTDEDEPYIDLCDEMCYDEMADRLIELANKEIQNQVFVNFEYAVNGKLIKDFVKDTDIPMYIRG